MDIKYALLGFLQWRSLSGYDLKKIMTNSIPYYWSGNNNQIYSALVALSRDGLVNGEMEFREHQPSRKIYSITDKGLSVLREWVMSPPELPLLRNSFLVQLAWADLLQPEELDMLAEKYEHEVDMQLRMLREQGRRKSLVNPARTAKEKYLWEMIFDNHIRFYENELDWIHRIREELGNNNGD